MLGVIESWTNTDGTTGAKTLADNVEAYQQGAPMFAISGDDTLTGAGANDLFVFAQPIGHDTIYNFNVASDQINLVGFNSVTTFSAVQANLTDNASGNAVITIGAGETITLNGVDASSLNVNNFVFNQTPVTENAGSMVISDGALLPLSGVVNNTGTIALNSTGDGTDLELVQNGITLQGGGQITLSDNGANAIFGTDPSITMTNVDNTISGAGQIGNGQMMLVNDGIIDSTATNPLVVDTGSNAVVNNGSLEADGGTLVMQSSVTGGGSATINGGTIEFAAHSDANVSFATTGSAIASAENVAFQGNSGVLKLDTSGSFTGTVSGFGAHDTIDLADISFGANMTLGYSANAGGTEGTLTASDGIHTTAAGGTLTVSDGTHTANIALLGQYAAAGFVMASDGHGGTFIADPPALVPQTQLTQPHA